MSLLDIYNARKRSKEEGKSRGNAAVGSLLEIYRQRTGQQEGDTSANEEDRRTWFQKGAFEDGWQKGDGIKAAAATKADAEENLTAGGLSIGEKILDALSWLGTAMAGQDLMQAAQNEMVFNYVTGKETANVLQNYQQYKDEMEDETAKFIAKDLYDAEKIAHQIISGKNYIPQKIIGYNTETDSFLGEKSDALVQSGGQLVAQVGANTILPGSGMALMATTAFGSEVEGAFRNGADFSEAGLSGAISAGAEVLTEKLGGISFGGKTLTDAAFSRLSRKMTSKLAKALITTGKVAADMTAEGAEELLSGYMSAIGQQLTYMEDKEIEALFSKEDALESFIGGVVLGGFGGVSEVARAKSKGVNPISGLTKNEEAVVNKVYEDELAQREKSGKLTAREKSKLYDKVLEDLEQGRISTDTIESILGGDTYKGYQEALAQESKLKKEIEELESLPDNAITVKQRERLTEARKELEGLDTKTAKSNLFSEVDKLTAKDTKLRESYNERTRRGQAFTAELSQYDEKLRPTIQRAIDNGEINNTRATHAFVEGLAKIEAEKGIGFDFTNNERLAELGLTVAGRNVGGYVDGANVTLNLSSSEALNKVVGHEVTHVFEGSGQYDALMAAMKEFAAEKGIDWDARVQEMTERYQNVKNADPEKELLADLVGEYLFTDSSFVENLSTKNPGLFKRIYEEIKYLAKTFAGTKQGAALEKVKKTFAEIYRDADVKNTAQTDGVRYSLNIKHTDGSVEVLADARSLTTEQAVEYLKQAKAGALRRDTYIPVRKDTPQVIIDTLKQVNENVENLSMVMNVEKAQRAMAVSNTGTKTKKHGDNVRKHGLLPEEIVEIINNLDSPNTVIYQTNRFGKDGKQLPNSIAVFVEYSSNGNEGMAAVEFENPRNEDAIGTEFGETSYHTVITVFEPDVERKGLPFDYVEELLSDPNNYELDIKRRQLEGSATGEKHPNTSNELPYTSSIRNPDEKVNGKFSLSANEQTTAPAGGYRITGEDIALAPTKEDIAQMEQGIATAPAALRNDTEELGAPTREDILQMEAKKGSLEEVLAEGASIRSQLRNNQEVLNAMQPVAEIQTPAEYEQMDITEKKKWVEEKLSPTGYKVERKGFGIIDFAKKRLKSAFNYFDKNSVEEASFEAIPFVLENGVEIENRNVHKDRNYGTVTIAAPITINGIRGNMAVVVKQTNGNYYKVHRVLTPDGSVFHLPEMTNEAESTPAGESPINGSLATPKDSASVISIPDNGEVVNGINNDTQEITAPTREDIMRMEVEKELHGPWRMADPLDQKVEKLYRMMLREEVSEEDYIAQLVKADRQYQQRGSRIEEALERVQQAYSKYQAMPTTEGNSHISMEDFVNSESPVWRNVAYNDDATKTSIMQSTHDAMVAEGSVVTVTQDVIDTVEQSFPDLRSMKKKERTPILKDAINKLKNNIRQFLTGLSNQNFEFEVNGKVLDAKLYSTGINEVLEKVTQEKANVLYSTEEIFRNARYLYSTPDYDGDPNIYRWNYFYTPVQIGDEIVGVRIAVRDVATPRESQIYNWGIKKDASLGGVGRGTNNRISHGASSDASINNIPEDVVGVKQEEVEAVLGEKGAYVSKQANALYDEVKSMQKGKRVSNTLSYLLDTLDLSEEHKAESYNSLRTALLNIRDNPNQTVNPNSTVEAAAREMLGREYDAMAEDFANAEGVAKSIYTKMESLRTELENNQSLREQSNADFDSEIARLQAEYEGKKNKNTKAANDILHRIERVQRLKSQVDADYAKRIDRLGEQLERISKPEYKTAMQRKAKMEEYTNLMAELVGDTSTWVDKKMGISYSTNTIRRNLRDIVRDENGNRDIAKADAIYDELQGKYNHNEAELKRESARIKEVFQKLGLNHAEDTYAHMLGEFQYNPDSKLSQEQLEEYYEKHKSKIDTQKVDKAIAEARKVFDDLIVRVNERLKEQGMRQIPYRKGYFPHFTNPKQTWLHKFFNWKPVDNEIPTSIAGLTEEFNPQRSWQSFDKQRTSDATDYSLEQGLDSYIHGALDWIYHIEDIQKRRALENHIRYVHSEEGIKKRIDEIRNNESYDADEAQELIDAVYAEAKNPLNNFVSDLRTGTNTLANKKSSLDRKAEEMTNRKIYSVMTNLNSRINANMVVGSFSSALTNFIPITQSWLEVSPVYSLKGMRDTIKSTIRDDGVVNKSDFLTNRLMNEEKLYQTGWDKVSEKAGIMMEAIDSFTSQTVWRSKYLQNMAEGMSENEAIKNADQFAENVIAGRSRGNQPTIFDAKNPITKIFTAFQLEVANQYGYMFKDAPQDAKNKGRLIKGYATAFLGAYAYNALYSSLVGRDAAFDPLSILEDLFRDLFGDDEEEPEEAILNLADNVLDEVPFIGGLMGGGRVPISSAIPYEGDYTTFITDLANGELSAKEMLKPLYYLAMPVAGGQLKKTNEGLKMFDEDLPVAGSYTDSGNLRFPVEEDSIADWLQAALFGQYASKNAREYFDNGWAPLKEKQIEEFASLDIPIADYREIRKQLGKLGTTADKVDYIGSLDLTVEQKNILVNNVVDRKEPVDMTGYDLYEDFDEFDFYIKNQEKYQFLKDNGIAYKTYNASEESREAYNWAFQNPEKYQVSRAVTEDTVTYKSYTKTLSEIKADKDSAGKTISGSRKKKVVQQLNGLDMEYGAKLVLYKLEYPSDDTYNEMIIQYVNGVEGFTFEQKATVLKELGFTVKSDGRVAWN